MGQFSFSTPSPDRLPPETVDRCYIAGMEGIPWASRNEFDDGVLLLNRAMHESGCLYVPWELEGIGKLTLSTASLQERFEPYQLHVELARGTLHRFRSYVELGRMLDFDIPSELDEAMSAATSMMSEVVVEQDEAEVTRLSDEVILRAAAGIQHACTNIATQLLVQRQRHGTIPTLWGGRIDETVVDGQHDQILDGFNTASITFPWRQIEPNAGEIEWESQDAQLRYCKEHGLKTFAGPLVRFTRSDLPDWTYLWEEDYENLRSYVVEHVQRVAQRFQGQLDVWHVASGLNLPKAIRLNEEQRVRLTMDCLDTVRAVDPKTPLVVSFSEPWAESLASEDAELSPWHFADYLVRSGGGPAALGLEIDWGYWPDGTQCRDFLELSYHLDRWSTLGLPLLVFVTGSAPDAEGGVVGEVDHPAHVVGQDYYDQLLTVLLAKQSVQGIVWNQPTDAAGAEHPGGGLFDAQGRPKPVLQTLANVRKAFRLS